ncbi:MAG: sugar ABC transporter permease [Oscillospiraceae bacterium]|nr:sugar ABC transporter permease [Oscillospiraceae bacterium]MBP1591236.1 sugar ABC transporter permease [Oscillospiraceae bacterium]MBR3023562.1 sugar ABC transporter permease [Oscillospiraceae bacterium]MBR3537009.1 sugar ABC transporter permease [Oscillospiraceae bacterium]MBR6835183.1 sugar ABC transporter permease [Oscillospiraceae bacterium]
MESIRKNKLAITVFMLPAVILFAGIIIIPIIMSFIYSLQDWNGITEPKFIGFDNYIELFTSKSAGFPKTTLNALLLAVLSVFIQLPLSLALALMISKGIKGERFFMTVFFIPVLMSTVVIGQLWLKIYNPNYGVLNVLLDKIGLHSLAKTAWLAEPKTVLLAAFLPNLWQYVGYHMLLMYAGIKSVSPDVIEAAKIDGANEWQINTRIIIPLLKPVIKICVIFAVTGSLKTFDLIYVLTRGGPDHASEVPSTLMVNMTFDESRYGYGSAIAVMIIFLCFFFAILIKKGIKTEDYDEK